MSALGESISDWLVRVNRSPLLAGALDAGVLGYFAALVVASYFWSRSQFVDFVAAGTPLDDGQLWATVFLAISVPSILFTGALLLFDATRRRWSLTLLILSTAPVIFFAASNPAGILGRNRGRRERETLTAISGDPHLAEVLQGAMTSGRFIAIGIVVLSLAWVLLRQRRRRFADPSAHHRIDDAHRRSARFESAVRIFAWVYPLVAVTVIPVVAILGAANAS